VGRRAFAYIATAYLLVRGLHLDNDLVQETFVPYSANWAWVERADNQALRQTHPYQRVFKRQLARL